MVPGGAEAMKNKPINPPPASDATTARLVSALALAVVFAAALPAGAAVCGDSALSDAGKYCSATAQALACACDSEARDDYFVTRAICTNEPERPDRDECFADALDSRTEDEDLCDAQHELRVATCKLLGEDRYDPEFEPSGFDKDFTSLTNPNPYFPLKIGNRWEYFDGDEERNVVEVLNKTKLIDDIRCIVVRDIVTEGGDLKEATDDWYAQAKSGDVWYCGEEVKNYESFDGDRPRVPELVDIDGSFKTDRNEDKPGIIALRFPSAGDIYTEEFSLGNAEDVTEILSTKYSYGKNADLDQGVPQALAQLLCSAGDCVVTKNYSLLEPGIFARKYSAKRIGVFLEVESDGQVVQLVKCNFDSRCASLPQP